MKKKLIPFILGLSMVAALPLAAHAEDTPEQNSGNVEYGNFATVDTTNAGETDVITAIPECTLTIPRDTTIKRGALSANIGRVTVDGHYFVKPYYVEVSATKNDFVKTENGSRIADPLAKQDILFDVATTNGTPQTTGTAAANTTLVQNGTVSIDGTSHKSTFSPTYAARRFWKDMTKTGEGNQDKSYKDGEVCDIKEQENIWLRIAETQWTGVEGNIDNTKPEGGLYKGSITFTATFRDNYADGMSAWNDYTPAQP